jgi:hypothetical protein
MPELTETAARLLRRGGSPQLWGQIVADILARRAQLFSVSNGSYLVMSITRHDKLFIHACAGQDAVLLMTLCIETARHNHCTSVLFRTQKKGLLRLLQEFNPIQTGNTTYRVAI